MPNPSSTSLRFKVAEALARDVGRAVARLDPDDMRTLGLEIGDFVEVRGKSGTPCKVLPAHKEARGRRHVQLDGLTRGNTGVSLGETVELRATACEPARQVGLAPIDTIPRERDLPYIGSLLDGLPVRSGDRVRATLFGNRAADFRVVSTAPKGTVVINPTTRLMVSEAQQGEATAQAPSYEDVAGLRPQLRRIREMIELPLRYPEVFERLGIAAPKGVLLHGPPGCGKTLIARAIAHETDAAFFTVSGPEVIHKFYGESEAQLRKLFAAAERKAPSILFLDEIDAIAPKRERVQGEVEKRVVAQLLALMDGLKRRARIIVIAATNLPQVLDPALRRPGRFDREIAISIPGRPERREILDVHSRGMPLADPVVLDDLAERTHGFVGADLEALCREAAMASLRRILPAVDFELARIPYELLRDLQVRDADFEAALREVEPSAIREVFVEVPSVHWTDVGGLTAVKQRLIELLQWPLTRPELFRAAGVEPSKGILLAGPPGCGKTLLARALATETQGNFISVKGPALLSKFVGESEREVREVFRKARQAAPCILFFDEIDALLPVRSTSSAESQVSERVLAQFLTELDGIEELKGVLVLGATNRLDRLDPAAIRAGRFDAIVEVPLPDAAARREILGIHLVRRPVAEDLQVADLVDPSDGLSAAEIATACNRAALAAVRRCVAEPGTAPHIRGTDLRAALDSVRAEHRLEI